MLSASLSPQDREESANAVPRAPRGTLFARMALTARTLSTRRALVDARHPRREAPETRSPLGVRLGGPHQLRPPQSSCGRKDGSAFVALHQPVRNALGGTGSLRSHRPENASARESEWLSNASRDALSDSRCPATDAGPKRDGRAHVGRWRGIEGAARPSGPRGRCAPHGRNGTAVTPARRSPRRNRSG